MFTYYKLFNLRFLLALGALLLVTSITSTPVSASQAKQHLDRFFAEVHSFNGSFVQTVYDENDEVIQDSNGDVALEKPGKFRWHYVEPYPQLILADGDYLWLYDPELLQATAKPIDEALGNAPIMLLTNIRPLEQDFKIVEADSREGLDWVELVPLVQDTEFHRIQIGLNEEGIQKMELHDHFAQKTVIEFTDLKVDVSFPQQHFEFVPPAGVDIVGHPDY